MLKVRAFELIFHASSTLEQSAPSSLSNGLHLFTVWFQCVKYSVILRVPQHDLSKTLLVAVQLTCMLAFDTLLATTAPVAAVATEEVIVRAVPIVFVYD